MSSVERLVIVAIGALLVTAPVLLFAGDPAGSLTREELVANDIDLRSYVRDLADEVGTSVQSVRTSDVPVANAVGDEPEVVRYELEAESRRLDRSEVHVYSKPTGSSIVDREKTGETTPGSVELKPGSHRIRVQFEETDRESAPKRVDLEKRDAPRLFFRMSTENP